MHGWTPLQVTAYLTIFNFSAMLATVATVTSAADYCPQPSEGFSFAAMMSIIKLATASADIVGSFLFEHFFHNSLAPLILVSAAFTAFAFVLVPLLHLGDKRQGQWIGRCRRAGPRPATSSAASSKSEAARSRPGPRKSAFGIVHFLQRAH